jgi:hypothetical protein
MLMLPFSSELLMYPLLSGILKTIPFVLHQAQKDLEKGMVFLRICFGFRQRRGEIGTFPILMCFFTPNTPALFN